MVDEQFQKNVIAVLTQTVSNQELDYYHGTGNKDLMNSRKTTKPAISRMDDMQSQKCFPMISELIKKYLETSQVKYCCSNAHKSHYFYIFVIFQF